MTTTFTYNDLDQPTSEAYTGGTLGGFTLTTGYDSKYRKGTLSLNTTPTLSYTFGYDDDKASRLTNVTDGTYKAAYSYLANSPLVSQISFYQSSTLRLQTTKEYDFLNRLQKIYSRASATTPMLSYYGYQYNDANQRAAVNLLDGSYWLYRYDSLGQIISGKKYWADGSPVPGQQYEYGFDDIGNRRYAKSGGDASGGSLRESDYSPNDLNEYASRNVPGSVDILGLGSPGSTVTVNGSNADYRRGEYFWKNLDVSLGSNPLWQSVSVSAGGGTPVTGNLLIPPSTQNFTYDLDGNLTSDGVWTYYYDAENRLYRIENPTTLTPTSARRQLLFEYDYEGRRIRKQVFLWGTSDYSSTPTTDTKFLYDGGNLIKEIAGTAWKAYMWGLDLSGTPARAGGSGGLLLFNGSSLGASFASYDANGNVVKLVKSSDSTATADYEYDPFGHILRITGVAVLANPIRFSSKYKDDETELIYYGDRFMSASLGRWINRDPLEEQSDLNLCAFVRNNPLSNIDPTGLETISDGIWVRSDFPSIRITGPRTGVFANKVIGSIKVDHAYIKAKFGVSMNEEYGNIINYINENMEVRNDANAKIQASSYIGAGFGVTFTPNLKALQCCTKLYWEQRFVRDGDFYFNTGPWWFTWLASPIGPVDYVSSGVTAVDFPGDTVSGYFYRNYGRLYKLTLYCDTSELYTIYWGYHVTYRRSWTAPTVSLYSTIF